MEQGVLLESGALAEVVAARRAAKRVAQAAEAQKAAPQLVEADRSQIELRPSTSTP